MPIQLHLGRDAKNHDAPVVMLVPTAEPHDAMAIMRLLHTAFPNEWAQISMEMIAPEKRLILNGDLPTN